MTFLYYLNLACLFFNLGLGAIKGIVGSPGWGYHLVIGALNLACLMFTHRAIEDSK